MISATKARGKHTANLWISNLKPDTVWLLFKLHLCLDRVKWIWYLSPMRAAKVQASLRIRAVSPEPPLLAHTSSVSRGTFWQKTRFLAALNGWACAIKIYHDGMLEDTNSLDATHLLYSVIRISICESGHSKTYPITSASIEDASRASGSLNRVVTVHSVEPYISDFVLVTYTWRIRTNKSHVCKCDMYAR